MSTIADQVKNAERAVDETWGRMPVPRGHLGAATWVLLTVCEDLMRMPLVADELADAFASSPRYLRWIDELKYALKHSLTKLGSECPAGSLRRAPSRMSGADYTAAADLMRLGMSFRAATIAFGAFHAGADRCEVRDGVLTFLPLDGADLRYRAREYMESTIAPNVPRAGSAILRVSEWLIEPPATVRTAIGMIRTQNRRVHSPADRDALDAIFEELPNTTYMLPPRWTSPFGDAGVVSRILRGVRAVCAWSFLRVTMGQVFHGKTGGGLEWLAPVTPRETLVDLVASIAGAPVDETRRLLELMTYGTAVQSPDPALQPFVLVGADLVCYAPLFVCGSSLERNLLALLARADSSAFDAASNAFEVHMTDLVRSVLEQRPWLSTFNSFVPGAQSAGEVDVIVIDSLSRQVLVLELWWMIPPGETREVLQRESTARAKAAQAARKREAALANLPALLTRSRLGANTDGWSVSCALVSESFLPISPLGGVSVLTRRTLQYALKRNDRLADVAAWIASEEWLPKEGEHFTREHDVSTIGDVRFSNLGVAVPDAGTAFARNTVDVE